MQYLFDRRDTVFMRYIVPCFLALALVFGFCASALVHADAVVLDNILLFTNLLAPILLDWGVRGLLDLYANSKEDYKQTVSQLPTVSVCDKGIVINYVMWKISGSRIVLVGEDGLTGDGQEWLNSKNPDTQQLTYLGSTIYYSYITTDVLGFSGSASLLSYSKGHTDATQVGFISGNYGTFVTDGTFDGSFHYGGTASAYVPFASAPTYTVNYPSGSGGGSTTSKAIYNDPTTRLGSISGNYLYLHDDFDQDTNPDAYDTFLNQVLVDEANMMFYNPVTGTSSTIKDWSYSYTNMSYDISLSDDSHVSVTWGDDNCTIIEGGKAYCLKYLPADFVPPHKHTYQMVENVAPSCTMSGYRKYRCSGCGEEYTEEIAALGHDWQCVDRVASSTDTAGYDLYRCSRCGEEKRDYGDGSDNSSSGGLFGSLANFIKRAIGWVLDKLRLVVDGINGITTTFKGFVNQVKGVVSGFTDFIAAGLGVLPSALVTLLWFSIVAGIVAAVISRIIH